MDFFSKLFSTPSGKKINSKSEHESDETGSEPPSADKYHESGTFCRESRVDQLDSPYSSILTVSPDNEQHCTNGLASSSTIITRTLDRWNPETCVRLLRMPSVQNYSGLRKLISESDKNWMVEFLDMGGLEVLFESVDRLSSKKSCNSSRLEHTLLLLQCVSCLKAVTNSHTALDHIIQQKTYAEKIAEGKIYFLFIHSKEFKQIIFLKIKLGIFYRSKRFCFLFIVTEFQIRNLLFC